MKHINGYTKYNEGIGSYFKSLVTGAKTDDDKIAKDILKNIDDIDFNSFGGNKLYFDYNGYSFICYPSGTCILNDNGDEVTIKSKFMSSVYNKGKDIYLHKSEQNRLEYIRKISKKNNIKVSKYIEAEGGLENLIEDYIKHLQNLGSLGLDPNDKFKSISNDGSKIIYYRNSIIIDGVIGMSKPYWEIRFNFNNNELELIFDINTKYKMVLHTDRGPWREEHTEWYNYMVKLKNELIEYNKSESEKNDTKKKGIIKRFGRK